MPNTEYFDELVDEIDRGEGSFLEGPASLYGSLQARHEAGAKLSGQLGEKIFDGLACAVDQASCFTMGQ